MTSWLRSAVCVCLLGSGLAIQAQIKDCDDRAMGSSCTRGDLRAAFAAAPALATASEPANPAADIALTDLTKGLKKPLAGGGQPGTAGLLLVMSPVPEGGIHYGPDGVDLVLLKVYAADTSGGRGQQLWTETYHGDPNQPKPLIWRRLAQQFQDTLKSK